MIATILKSSSTFSAVDYNERKVSKGTAELMEITNFGYLQESGNLSAKALQDYLVKYSSINQNTKSTQFHVSISCKKQDYTYGQLLDIAHQYLKEMGYAAVGQPTLIYAHHDTGNNHIHIVTSRISPDGRKISDHNERIRSQAIINRIMGVRPKHAAKSVIQQALAYSFNTLGQFQSILESCGYESYVEDEMLNVKKGGMVLDSIPIADVQKRSCKKEDTENRRKQLKAILLKYQRLAATKEELSMVLKKKFGVSLVFVGKKDTPYGYMVVDHKDKTVYKGKDILPIKELLKFKGKNKSSKESLQTEIPTFIHQLLEENNKQTIGDLNKVLWRKFGVNIYHDGFVRDKKQRRVSQVEPGDFKILRSNFKKEWLQSFNPSTEDEKAVLCKFGHIKNEADLHVVADRKGDKVEATISHIKDILNSGEKGKVYEELSNSHFIIIRSDDRMYAIDMGGRTIVNLRETDIDISKLVRQSTIEMQNTLSVGDDREQTPTRSLHSNTGRLLRPTASGHHANREWEVGVLENWDDIDDERKFKR